MGGSLFSSAIWGNIVNLFCLLSRFLGDQVKSQKSPQVEKGEETMGKVREAKPAENGMIHQR